MTRIFAYEYTVATRAETAPGSAPLEAEGAAMLEAVLEDLQAIPGVDAFTIRAAGDEPRAFAEAARRADFALIIAPEFNEILSSRCQWAIDSGCKLLGPGMSTLRLAADKLAMAEFWLTRRVPTPETLPAPECPWGDYVIKPRFGAGALHTRRGGPVAAHCELGPMIVQPFIAGAPASVAFLTGPNRVVALPPAAQRLAAAAGRFQYRGGRVPLTGEFARRAAAIATAALDGLPDLCGPVGVDVILGVDGRDWAVEINPRMTTSYLGLRRLARFNLAEALLAIATGKTAPPLDWRTGPIDFAPEAPG